MTRTPDNWIDWVTNEAWLHEQVTRTSAGMHECVRNPRNRSDPTRYPIHWLETKKSTAVLTINQLGKVRFGDHFQLSYTVVTSLIHFSVKPVTRSTCLCRWHLQWQLMIRGLYNFRKRLRVHARIRCDCENIN